MTGRSRLARQTATTWATLVCALLCLFWARAIVARVLGPEAMGTYVLMLTVALLGGTLLSLGLPAYNSSFAAEQPRRVLLSNSLVWNGAMFAALSAVCGPLLLAAGLPPSRQFLILGVWMAPLMSAMECTRGVLQGSNAVIAYNVVGFASGALNLAAVGALAALGRLSLASAALCWIGSVVVSVILGARALVGREGLPRPDVALLVSSLKFGGQAWLSQLTGVVNIRIALVLIEILLGTAAVGVYSIAATIGEVLLYFPNAVAAVTVSRYAGASRIDAARLLVRSSIAVLAINAACALGLALVAGQAVPLVFGAEYAASVPVLLALLPGVVLYSPIAVSTWYFNAHLRRPVMNLVVAGFSACCGALLILVLAPVHGLVGVGIATAAGYAAAAVLNVVLLRRTSDLSYSGFIHAARFPPAAMSAPATKS